MKDSRATIHGGIGRIISASIWNCVPRDCVDKLPLTIRVTRLHCATVIRVTGKIDFSSCSTPRGSNSCFTSISTDKTDRCCEILIGERKSRRFLPGPPRISTPVPFVLFLFFYFFVKFTIWTGSC